MFIGGWCEQLEARRLLSSLQIGDVLYFTTSSDLGTSLMRSDLDGSNSIELGFWTGRSGSATNSPGNLFEFQGKLYFSAGIQELFYSGAEPWISDGTPEGTDQISDIYEGSVGSEPHDFTVINDHLLFVARNNSRLDCLFTTDGTEDGTVQLSPNDASHYPYVGSSAANFKVSDGLISFEVQNYPDSQLERWVSDGTVEGTHQADAGVLVEDDQIRIFGSNGNDKIDVRTVGDGDARILINGVQSPLIPAGFTSIVIYGLDGDDVIGVDQNVTAQVTINGDNGNDTLAGGSGSDSINGGDGNDLIQGLTLQPVTGNHDTLNGSFGDDTIIGSASDETILGSTGDDSIDGGGGNDIILPDGVAVPPPAPVVVTFALSRKGVFSVTGTDGDDTILIRRRPSRGKMLEAVVNGVPRSYRISDIFKLDISAAGGNDKVSFDPSVALPTFSIQIRGGDGNDTIQGSAGADRISGGDGNDSIYGSRGNDVIYGDAGDDTLFGGDGKDVINAGDGVDAINSGSGRDRIIGTISIDHIEADPADIIAGTV